MYRGPGKDDVKGSVPVLLWKLHHRGARGRKGRECKFPKIAHRTFDIIFSWPPVYLLDLIWMRIPSVTSWKWPMWCCKRVLTLLIFSFPGMSTSGLENATAGLPISDNTMQPKVRENHFRILSCCTCRPCLRQKWWFYSKYRTPETRLAAIATRANMRC